MRRRRRDGSIIRRFLIGAILLMLFLSAGCMALIKLVVEPNMEDVARIRAQVLVSRTVNRALAEQFRNEADRQDLFSVKSGEDGIMDMVQADSIEINILMSELSINLQESFQNMGREPLEVPLGSLMGSKILSQTGPDVTLSIVPLSVSSMDFRTEFETQGINQTKYKIYIILECRVRVLAPFSSRNFTTSNTVLIAEAVILGEVPNSYVEVPKEDILDVTDE
ncbi:MAG: sporulation protein YunB [Bacillota bacterium]|nr:sporulation protein YunB [Bacillota bacterium]